MKMKYIVTGIAVFVLFATVCTMACMAQQPIPGGYTSAAVTSHDVIQAASFAVRAQQKTSGKTSRLELVEILDAESQVVAGVNYRLKLKVRQNGKEKTAKAVVWWQAWRKPEPYQLISWSWK